MIYTLSARLYAGLREFLLFKSTCHISVLEKELRRLHASQRVPAFIVSGNGRELSDHHYGQSSILFTFFLSVYDYLC